jgi:hypothetical protein
LRSDTKYTLQVYQTIYSKFENIDSRVFDIFLFWFFSFAVIFDSRNRFLLKIPAAVLPLNLPFTPSPTVKRAKAPLASHPSLKVAPVPKDVILRYIRLLQYQTDGNKIYPENLNILPKCELWESSYTLARIPPESHRIFRIS